MTTTRMVLPLALAATLVLTGCGPSAGGDSPGAATVSAVDGAFSPAALDVAVGDTVTWVNDDDVAHSVAFEDDALGASDLLEEGDSYEVTLAEAGTFAYVCAVHPEMTGSVTVAAAP